MSPATTSPPMMNNIMSRLAATLLRAMAAKLKVQGRINPHRDMLRSFHMGHRIHVPITTNAAVRFTIDGKPYAFEVGKAYELNNQKKHSVINMGSEDRISFIFDYVPADQLPNTQA